MIVDVLLTLTCFKTFLLLSAELTLKRLKIHLLERAQVCRATKLHT